MFHHPVRRNALYSNLVMPDLNVEVALFRNDALADPYARSLYLFCSDVSFAARSASRRMRIWMKTTGIQHAPATT